VDSRYLRKVVAKTLLGKIPLPPFPLVAGVGWGRVVQTGYCFSMSVTSLLLILLPTLP
jgi:hypothetical protein